MEPRVSPSSAPSGSGENLIGYVTLDKELELWSSVFFVWKMGIIMPTLLTVLRIKQNEVCVFPGLG